MDATSRHYLRDLGYLIREAAEASASSDGGDAFEAGRLMAYYEVVSLMLSQAASFGLPAEDLAMGGLDREILRPPGTARGSVGGAHPTGPSHRRRPPPMIDHERAEILQTLGELSEACPEYRFGQLIANLAMLSRGDADGAVWDIEDAELLTAARKHLADWNTRHEPATSPDVTP